MKTGTSDDQGKDNMHHDLQELNNNLKTLFVNWPGSSAASIQFWFRAGSALEKKEDYGIETRLKALIIKE